VNLQDTNCQTHIPKFSEGVWLYMCAGNTLRIHSLVFSFRPCTILCISNIYTSPSPPPPQTFFAKTRSHGLHALQVIILSYVTPILPPLALYLSCLHTTLASLLSQKSSHTVPHTPLMQTSTLPALFTGPLTKRSVSLVQCWAAVGRENFWRIT